MDKTLTVGALQLPTLGMNATRLEYYLKKAKERNATLMLLGEYVLNHFFKDLSSMPLSMIKAQSGQHLQLLKHFAQLYDMTFIAPLIQVRKKKLFKTIIKVTPKQTRTYMQQILIDYPHWDEASYFANEVTPLHEPMVFRHQGFNIMVMGGFEIHFPPFWETVRKRKIDLVLIPTASTFGSHRRWREIITTHAFLYGCYVLRANRLGEYSDGITEWKFYGDSMIVSPEGEIEMMLEDKESMLIEEISKHEIKAHRRLWRFERSLRKRGVYNGVS